MNELVTKENIELVAICIMALFSILSLSMALSAHSKYKSLEKRVSALQSTINSLKEYLRNLK
jgi:predicted enzyme involved in methoxymalonyl-ACP biosynthesis